MKLSSLEGLSLPSPSSLPRIQSPSFGHILVLLTTQSAQLHFLRLDLDCYHPFYGDLQHQNRYRHHHYLTYFVSLFDRPWSRTRSVIEAACLMTTAVFVASHIPRIVELWSFVGSILASVSMFVLPGIFYLKLRRRPIFYDRKNKMAVALVVFGVVIGILTTIDSIMNIINGAPTD